MNTKWLGTIQKDVAIDNVASGPIIIDYIVFGILNKAFIRVCANFGHGYFWQVIFIN